MPVVTAVSGQTMYAGGYFTQIGGQERNTVAALDTTTGQATSWDPARRTPPQGVHDPAFGMYALAVSGQTVSAAGPFISIGGKLRYHLAGLDAATGEATAWSPKLVPQSPYGVVDTLAVGPDGSLWAGGSFSGVGNTPQANIARFAP